MTDLMQNSFLLPFLFCVISIFSGITATSFIQRDQVENFGFDIHEEYFLDTMFNWWNVNFDRYDLYGNELPRPDRTLLKRHFYCKRQSNDSEIFRKFAGLLMAEECPDALKSIASFSDWTFYRVNELKAYYYSEASEITLLNNPSVHPDTMEEIDMDRNRRRESFDFWSVVDRGINDGPELDFPEALKEHAYKLKKTFPLLYNQRSLSEEQLSLFELLIADLFTLILPNLRGTLLDCQGDVSGILMLLFLIKADDLDGYSDEFIEFYRIAQKFAGGSVEFNLPSLRDGKEKFDRLVLLDELFILSLELNFVYTFELFCQLDLIDVKSRELMEFVLKKASCPVIINRLLDSVPWDVDSRVHFIYEKYPQLLSMIYDNEASKVDWNMGEFGAEEGGRTLLGRMLSSMSSSAFEDENELEMGRYQMSTRDLVKEFLSTLCQNQKKILLLTSRNPDRDIIDECMERESEGMSMLFEYFNHVKLDCVTLAKFISRIVEVWKKRDDQYQNLPHSKLFKYLVKRCDRDCSEEIIPVLKEAYELLRTASDMPRITSSSSINSRGSSNDLRTMSGEFFRPFLSSFDSTKRSSTSSPIQIPVAQLSPRRIEAKIDFLSDLVHEMDRIAMLAEDKILINSWKQDLDQFSF